MSPSPRACFAYYCSGHGYGHATRVSAFASHLLTLPSPPTIHIVSSAPAHVFSDSIALGAQYRSADIDPVIVQPLAYRVDREKSVEALKAFLDKKERKLQEEAEWLASVGADCVLSDAAFLAFLAANRTRVPSILITNFTFDSVFSYLASTVDQSRSHCLAPNAHHDYFAPHAQAPDPPIPQKALDPLVQQIYDGYRHADLLLRLPGAIPIPSFAKEPSLPAPAWIDPTTETFSTAVTSQIYQDTSTYTLLPSIPFPSDPLSCSPPKPLGRAVNDAPMLVRLPSEDIYTPQGRSRLLSSLSVPTHLHDPTKTKILVVSFGGQVFHKPSRSRTPSRPSSTYGSPQRSTVRLSSSLEVSATSTNGFTGELVQSLSALAKSDIAPSATKREQRAPPPLFSPSHIYIPGAPAPASRSPLTPTPATFPSFNTIPPTPDLSLGVPASQSSLNESDAEVGLILPDDSWIAIVCGVSDSKEWRSYAETPRRGAVKEANGNGNAHEDDELPEGFYIAPKNVYMPDLMAVGDVLLGKLGYGTVSECVDSCTPFVYVSRPLFVEEHGLRLYLSREGVGVEMEREEYEAGNWAAKVAEAWVKGAQRKCARRMGVNVVDRRKEGREMASFVVGWVRDWYEKVGQRGSA